MRTRPEENSPGPAARPGRRCAGPTTDPRRPPPRPGRRPAGGALGTTSRRRGAEEGLGCQVFLSPHLGFCGRPAVGKAEVLLGCLVQSPRRGHRGLPTLLLRDAAPTPPSPAFSSKSLPYSDPGAGPGEALRQDVLKAGDDSLSLEHLSSAAFVFSSSAGQARCLVIKRKKETRKRSLGRLCL